MTPTPPEEEPTTRPRLFVPERKPHYFAAFYLDPSPDYMDERIFYVYPAAGRHEWFPMRRLRELGTSRRWYVTAAQAKASGLQGAPRGSKEKIRVCKVWPITIPKGAVRVGWAFVQTCERGKGKPDGVVLMCTSDRFSSLDMVNEGTADLRLFPTRGEAEKARKVYTKGLRDKACYGVRAVYALPAEEKAASALEPSPVVAVAPPPGGTFLDALGAEPAPVVAAEGRYEHFVVVHDTAILNLLEGKPGYARQHKYIGTRDEAVAFRDGRNALTVWRILPDGEHEAALTAARRKTREACAADIASWFGLVDGCSWELVEAWAKANAPILREATAKPGGPLTLRKLQQTLPWSDTYRQAFRGNTEPHRDFRHALIHIVKAAGALASLVDELDHVPTPTTPGDAALGVLHTRYLADVVISAIRAANTFPSLIVDLQQEVVDRLARNVEKKGTAP